MQETVKLPRLGEDVVSGTVVKIVASPGDKVATGDTLIEIETGKALVPVPSSVSGKITELIVRQGQEIRVGEPLVVIETEEVPSAGVALEGGLPMAHRSRMRSSTSGKPSSDRTPERAITVIDQRVRITSPVSAGPAARKLARELGVEINYVTGTRAGGRVDKEDIKAYVRDLMYFMRAAQARQKRDRLPDLSLDFSRFGAVERKPLSPLRKTVAARMSAAWDEIPHVFQFHEVDIGATLEALEALKKRGEPVTLTAMLVQALASILQEMPNFNASLDLENGMQVLKKDVHMGIAVDTEAGLIVPVLKDAEEKSVEDIARELTRLAQAARERTLKPEELQGASFTLSNLGGIGGGPFTPLINPPQVAVLGVARSIVKPVYKGKKWVPRTFLPLTLAYDHRLIDGADAARFMVRLEKLLIRAKFNSSHKVMPAPRGLKTRRPSRLSAKRGRGGRRDLP
jgi:pyruvate dehydrogenase E2 component (dihydrolipoamide acetyltransferase)